MNTLRQRAPANVDWTAHCSFRRFLILMPEYQASCSLLDPGLNHPHQAVNIALMRIPMLPTQTNQRILLQSRQVMVYFKELKRKEDLGDPEILHQKQGELVFENQTLIGQCHLFTTCPCLFPAPCLTVLFKVYQLTFLLSKDLCQVLQQL